MSSEAIYTEGDYAHKHPRWHTEDSAWKAAHILRIIERNALTPRTVCEVGCGAGEILRSLHDALGPQTTFEGREFSPQAFEMCKPRESERLKFILTDSLKTRQPFDLLLLVDVIEHVPDYLGMLKEAHVAGRHKILHIPLDLSVQTVLRDKPLSYLRSQVGHIHYFTKQTALDSLSHCGFRVIDHFYTSPSTELASNSRLMSLARWPRKAAFSLNEDLAARVLGGHSLMVLAE